MPHSLKLLRGPSPLDPAPALCPSAQVAGRHRGAWLVLGLAAARSPRPLYLQSRTKKHFRAMFPGQDRNP